MPKISSIKKSYLAGFLDADGSIYAQAKPNKTYRFGFQIVFYIAFYQSSKKEKSFLKIFSGINLGCKRLRKDGIIEYIISKQDEVIEFLDLIEPYVQMKKEQVKLIRKIIDFKGKIKNKKDFEKLIGLIDEFRDLNYSKKRKKRILTP